MALFGVGERAVPFGRSRFRAHQLLSERAQSALASLRAAHSGPTVLRLLLRWLALQCDLFSAPADGGPLLAVDPDFGSTLPSVPARCLITHDARAEERAALVD